MRITSIKKSVLKGDLAFSISREARVIKVVASQAKRGRDAKSLKLFGLSV